MFVVADGLLLRSLPFPNAQELAVLSMRTDRVGSSTVAQSIFVAWRRIDTFTGVEAANTDNSLVETDAGDAVLTIARVSPGLLTLVGGVRPTRGRLFTSSDGDREVIIGETTWSRLSASRVLERCTAVSSPGPWRWPHSACLFLPSPCAQARLVCSVFSHSSWLIAAASLPFARVSARRVQRCACSSGGRRFRSFCRACPLGGSARTGRPNGLPDWSSTTYRARRCGLCSRWW